MTPKVSRARAGCCQSSLLLLFYLGYAAPEKGRLQVPCVSPAASGQRYLHHGSNPPPRNKANNVGASWAPSCHAGFFVAACGQWKITGWCDSGGCARQPALPFYSAMGIQDMPPFPLNGGSVMGLHANLWESTDFASLRAHVAGPGRACHPGVLCPAGRRLGWRCPPPHLRLWHRCLLWACLCCVLAFSSTEEPVLSIYGAVSRAAHLCFHNSGSARPPSAGCPHPKCSATRQGGSSGTLLAPLFAPQGLKFEARHLLMPWGSVLLPAQAGWVLGCRSPALRSLGTPYLI